MASAAGGDRDASCTNDPNFAVICVFLEKFGHLCGLEFPNFINLQNYIENTDEVPPELLDLLVKLLRKNRYTVHAELWERALVKFCYTYSNQDAWEVERFGYKKSRLPVKLNILKSLLESQFDRNGKLKTAIGTMKAAELRSHPIGRDKFGNAYWTTLDNKACIIRIYQEHLDEETWQIVASNRDEFAKLIQGLKSDKPVMPSLSICDEDSSSNSLNDVKGTENSVIKPVNGENSPTSKVEIVDNGGNDGEKENIILKITKNRIEEVSKTEEEVEEEEEEEEQEEENEVIKERTETETNPAENSEPQQQLRPSLLASKPPSKKPVVHPKKRANEIENEIEEKKPKERLTLLGQQQKDKIKKPESENDQMDEEEVEEEEEYSDEEELEEEEVEEEEDEEEEVDGNDEVENEPEVTEAIEDPVVKVTGEGTGVENEGLFLEFISSGTCESDMEYGEVIEEDIIFFYGEGSGRDCCVGNSKEKSSGDTEIKSDIIVNQTGCLNVNSKIVASKELQNEDTPPLTANKETNNETESHAYDVSSNSSSTLVLKNKNEENQPVENDLESTETKEQKHESNAEVESTPEIENTVIDEIEFNEKVGNSPNEVNSNPVVGKSHPPERDKMDILFKEEKPENFSTSETLSNEGKIDKSSKPEEFAMDPIPNKPPKLEDIPNDGQLDKSSKPEELQEKDETEDSKPKDLPKETTKDTISTSEDFPKHDKLDTLSKPEVLLRENTSVMPTKPEDLPKAEDQIESPKSEELQNVPQMENIVTTTVPVVEIDKPADSGNMEIPTEVESESCKTINGSKEREEESEILDTDKLVSENQENKTIVSLEPVKELQSNSGKCVSVESIKQITSLLENTGTPIMEELESQSEKDVSVETVKQISSLLENTGTPIMEELQSQSEKDVSVETVKQISSLLENTTTKVLDKELGITNIVTANVAVLSNDISKQKHVALEEQNVTSVEPEIFIPSISKLELVEHNVDNADSHTIDGSKEENAKSIDTDLNFSKKINSALEDQESICALPQMVETDGEKTGLAESLLEIEKPFSTTSTVHDSIVNETSENPLTTTVNLEKVPIVTVAEPAKIILSDIDNLETLPSVTEVTVSLTQTIGPDAENTKVAKPVLPVEEILKPTSKEEYSIVKGPLEISINSIDTLENLSTVTLTETIKPEPSEINTNTTVSLEKVSITPDITPDVIVASDIGESSTPKPENSAVPIVPITKEEKNISITEPVKPNIVDNISCNKNENTIGKTNISKKISNLTEPLELAITEKINLVTKKEKTIVVTDTSENKISSTESVKLIRSKFKLGESGNENQKVTHSKDGEPSSCPASTLKNSPSQNPKEKEITSNSADSKKLSLRKALSFKPEQSAEINGISSKSSNADSVANEAQFNQDKLCSEPKSNNEANPVPKQTNSNRKSNVSTCEQIKSESVDEIVSEPFKNSKNDDIIIPEIKITEVDEPENKDDPKGETEIEPHHLKAPEIDTKEGCITKVMDECEVNDFKTESPKNIQSFSLDFIEDDDESEKTPASTPLKRGRKIKPSPANKGGKNKARDPLELDEPEADSKSTRKSVGQRKKRLEVEPALIIKEEENETPVRQSRRIAQLKIREEAERRKLEEMVLKQMKEDSDRKKKEEEKKKNPNAAESDPDADVEQEEDEEEESDSGSEKKKMKKPKKKRKKDGNQPWQTSSGTSDSEDNDEELDILEHEEDEALPPLKSDHEFSPESDMEDETQVVPMKRARTVKKDKTKEEEEEEDITDENPEHACQKCGKHDHPEWILLCDSCDKGYHCSCLTPVLFIIPEGDWFCPPCQHQKLIDVLSVKLEEFDALIKQKELEENRKRRLHYTSVSVQNVVPISKKEPRVRIPSKNRSRTRVPRRRRRSSDEDDDDHDDRKRRKSSSSTSSSSSSSSSGDSDDNSSDDEPIYKLRKRRQAAVSYRFNEFDDLINSAIKDEMDEVKGAGNLGRGKDISTIIEADKEEKRLKEQVQQTDVNEENIDSGELKTETTILEPKTEDMDLEEEPESKKILNDEDLLKEEDEKEKSEAESENSDIIPRPGIIKRSSSDAYRGKKKSRKLNSLDIESDDDGSDEDFKGASSDSDEDEELSVSSASESSLENKWSKKKKKNKSGGRRLRTRRKRLDEAFINDNSDDTDEVKRLPRKRKKKEESDFSDFDDDEDEEEDIDSEDLCDSSSDSDSDDSDGAWKPKNKRRKTSSSKKQTPVHKRPIIINRKKTKKLDEDEKSFKVGMTKKKVMAKAESNSEDDNKARKTRGRKITYLEDFDESSDDGIRPGVKRPDTPPEERALFIQKQEEIKRMLAAKNTDAAKVMATPVLKPIKPTNVEEPLMSDSISTVPKQIIQNAKVLDPEFLKNKQNPEFDEEFDEELPEDFDPEDMDEDEIAKMMEEEDFAQQQLKLAGEAIRNKKLKEAELNRKKELEKLKQSQMSDKPISEIIIPPIATVESVGPTPLTQLQTIQPPLINAPIMSQARAMLHPSSSILSHGNPLQPGLHPSIMTQGGPPQIPNMMIPSMSDTMRLLRPEFDIKKRNRKSILDLGLPKPSGYQPTHIPSQMPPQLPHQMMSRPPVAHLPPMAHLPPTAHMPPGPQGPRAFQMGNRSGHLPPHLINQIPPAHSMHSNPVRMAPPNVTVLPPNIPSNVIPNTVPNANEPIIPTTVLSVANQKQPEQPASISIPISNLSTSNSSSVINSSIPLVIPNSAEALNAASQSELDALKRRGRRKKITPLRDPNKPNPGLADLSQAHATIPKTVEAHNIQAEKKSNPILAERLTASPSVAGPPEQSAKVIVTPPTQIFTPRISATASVITRLQQPPRPHHSPPFSQAPSRYFAPSLPRQPLHPVRSPFSGNPPPGIPPVTEPGPHYLTSDSRQPGGGHMFRPSLLHGFTGPPNPLHPLQVPSTQSHLVRGPTPPRDYSGGLTHPPPPPPFTTPPTSQYGDFYPSPNQAIPANPNAVERHQQSASPEQPPPFEQYESLKSIPVSVAENASSQFETTNDDTVDDGSRDGVEPGDSTGTDGNSNSGPTSEFSGLVSYFSSQQDDLDT